MPPALPIPLLDADWNHWPDGIGDRATVAAIAASGCVGIEVGIYDPDVELAPDRIARLRTETTGAGVALGALLWSLPAAGWPDGALTAAGMHDRLRHDAEAIVRTAVELGLDLIGMWPGADLRDGGPLQGARRTTVLTGLSAIAAIAGAHGVRVAIEAKPGTIVDDVPAVLELCDAVGESGLGVLLDTAHELAAGTDVPAAISAAGDRLWHVHLGDADPVAGDADDDLPPGAHHDFAPILRALVDAGYAGCAALDLYGVVSSGAMTGAEAARRSRSHLVDAWSRA